MKARSNNALERLLKRSFSAIVVSATLVGCAAYQPVPSGYDGPVATLSDLSIGEDRTKAQFFVVLEVVGHPIRNSLGASASASYGQGFLLTTKLVERQIPARPMKVKLKGTHATGAPIHSLVSQAMGTFYSVEGEVDFSPLPNKHYFVWGELKEHGSAVWITEESRNGEPVTEKVIGK